MNRARVHEERGGDGAPRHDAQGLTARTAAVGSVSGTTAGYFHDVAASCGGEAGPDVVYALTLPSAATVTAKVTPGASGYRPVVSVRSGSCPGTEAACKEAPAAGSAAEVAGVALGAGTHYLWVDGLGGTSGPFTLDVTVQ